MRGAGLAGSDLPALSFRWGFPHQRYGRGAQHGLELPNCGTHSMLLLAISPPLLPSLGVTPINLQGAILVNLESSPCQPQHTDTSDQRA